MPKGRLLIHAVLFVVLFAVVVARVFLPTAETQPDSKRYIHMGLNIADHGVLTGQLYAPDTPPAPGLPQAGPLTGVEIAAAVLLDDRTRQSLICVAANPSPGACALDIPVLLSFYAVETFIFHVLIFFIAKLVMGSSVQAWLAVALSLGFKETKAYATSVLTEPSYMMLAALFVLLWVYAWKRPERFKLWFGCGVVLGLTALVKPAWSALLPGLAAVAAALVLWRRDLMAPAVRAAIPFAAGAVCVLGLLLVRNVVQLDHWGLSDPVYLGKSLAHRLAFNAMTWREWAMGWIYFLPDFGDKVSTALFGKAAFAKLGWGPQSYYIYGHDVLHAHAVAQTSPEEAGDYLLRHNFFNDPVKGLAVSALLMWRGMFVGNLMGLVALVLAGPVLYAAASAVRRDILLIALPLVMIAGVNALVSVSLLRYNIPLIIPYVLVMTVFLSALGRWFWAQAPEGLRATANTFLPNRR